MFTGLIEEVGEISKINTIPEGKYFVIKVGRIMHGLAIGDSIAVDGVCLTTVSISSGEFQVQAVKETLGRTTLGIITVREKVNLERAMSANGRFGGHFIQGHVDGLAQIISWKHEGESAILTLRIPEELSRYIVQKGSIAVNGISLTVAKKKGETIDISLIPTTLAKTNLHFKKAGDFVNIEVDMIAKYVENFTHSVNEPLTVERLRKWGYENK